VHFDNLKGLSEPYFMR